MGASQTYRTRTRHRGHFEQGIYRCLLHFRDSFTFATVKTDPVRYAVVCATAGLLSPSVFLIAIRACIQRDVQSVELRLLVRHLPYRALALVESSELKPNVGSARAIAVLRETKETKFW